MSEKNDPNAAPPEESAPPDSAAAASETEGDVETAATNAAEPTNLPDALTMLAELRATIVRHEEESAKVRDQFLRERADLENFKKRMTREKSEALRYASEPLIRDLLPVIDNIERALNAAPPPVAGEADALRDGVAMVARQFDDILTRFGVSRVEATDRPFDPNEHEALAHVETTLKEPGSVLDEHLPGYRLHERLLRAAQVTVAKAPGSQGN